MEKTRVIPENLDLDLASALAGSAISSEKTEEIVENSPVEKTIENQDANADPEAKPVVAEPSAPVEEVSEENKVQKANRMVDITKLPDEMQEYFVLSQQENFNKEEYLENKRIRNEVLSLDDKSFYKLYLEAIYKKDGSGVTDEDIESEINSKSVLQLKSIVPQLKEDYLKAVEEPIKKLIEEYNAEKLNWSDKEIESYKENINKVIERNKNIDKAFGLPLSQADKEVLPKVFEEYSTINPETNKSKLDQLLENEDLLYQVVAMIHFGGEEISGRITDIKEEVKTNILKKLGIKPDVGSGSGSDDLPSVSSSFFV
jgi:hypothetical protein